MSISDEILRIQTNRNTMRTKLIDLGLVQSSANLDDIAAAVSGIDNRGSVSVEILEGTSYTIPAGYHNGSGTVKAMTDTTGEAEKYKTQAKTVTPTKKQQSVSPDTGHYALSAVTVEAIPDNYQDVTSVTATAADVLANKVIVDSTGKSIAGTMANNGAVSKTLDTTTTSYTVPAGYHNGSGKVSVATETKTATPTKAAQDINASSGKVLSKVTVNPIPDAYQDITVVTAAAADVLSGKKIVGSNGAVATGTMTDNGAVSQTISVVSPSYTIPAGYHNGGGKVSVNTETKAATPSKDAQVIIPTSGNVLSKVLVSAIPDAYQDVTSVTAGAADVLTGKNIVDATGAEVAGTMANNGAVAVSLTTATTSYTVPKGYHNGSGKVSITTESKSVTPAKSVQTIAPTSGKVLASVSVAAIPAAYQNVTNVTAGAADVLIGKTIVDAEGTEVAGTMANNGAVTASLNTTTTSYTVPGGYHSGAGKVSITLETKSATPTKSAQTITPTSGKVLSSVSVAAIPAAYQDVTGVTATAATVLAGSKFVDKTGASVDGTMANNGGMNKTFDGLSATSVTIPAGYTSGGTVSLTKDIENALAAI